VEARRLIWIVTGKGAWVLHREGCAHLKREDVAAGAAGLLDATTVDAAEAEIAVMMGEDQLPDDERSRIDAAPCVRKATAR
jgi:hypothetical protein